LGNAATEGSRREAGRRPEKRGFGGRVPECVLSVDSAADGGSGLDLCGDYAWRQRTETSRCELAFDSGGSGGSSADRAERIHLLCLLRQNCDTDWRNRDERDDAAVIILAGVHRGADLLEWREWVAEVAAAVRTLMRPTIG